MRSFLKSMVFTVTLTASASAFAQDAANKDMARAKGVEGQRALEEGQFQKAEEAFSTATQLYPKAPTLFLGLARAQLKLDKCLSAAESFKHITNTFELTADTPKPFKEAVASANAEVAEAEKCIAYITITVSGVAPGAKAPVVTVDNQVVPAVSLGTKRSIDPGTHTLKVTAEGMKPREKQLTIEKAGTVEEKIALEKETAAVVVSAPTNAPKSEGPSRTPAYIAFGVGGAGLVVGTITGLMALGKKNTLKETCPNNVCPQDQKSNLDSYKTLGAVSTIGFIVGAVGVAAGGILLVIPKKETAKAAYISPYLGFGGVGATGQF